MEKFKKENKSMNDWMDETEKLVNSLSVNMDPKKASRVQDKINVSIQRHHDVFFFFSLIFLSLSNGYVFSEKLIFFLKTEDLLTCVTLSL